MAEPDDRRITPEVIESCRRGDRAALQLLYEAYKNRVYSIAFYFFHRDASTASDVTQQVFLKLMADMRKFRGDSAFTTWLYRFVVNVCLDRARRMRADARRYGDGALLRQMPDPSRRSDERLLDTEATEAVQHAIAALPPKLRVAILLRYFDELSYEDMATALNCSIGTVSSRLSRGHRLLAKALSPLRASTMERG